MGYIINRLIKIFRAVAGCFYNNNPFGNGIFYRGKIIGPPFNGNISSLTNYCLIVVGGPCPVHFEQNQVAGTQVVGSLDNRLGSPQTVMRNGHQLTGGRNSGHPERILCCSQYTQYSCSMIPGSTYVIAPENAVDFGA